MDALKHVLNVALIVVGLGGAAQDRAGLVTGLVQFIEPDGSALGVPGVRLTLTCPRAAAVTTVSDEHGQFRFANVPRGHCSVATDMLGFRRATASFALAAEPIELPITLQHEVLSTGLTVVGAPPAVRFNGSIDEAAPHLVPGLACRYD